MYSYAEHPFVLDLSNSSMRATVRLLQHTAQVTLFSRANCSLCDNAKSVIMAVERTRTFQFDQVDVMAKGQEGWKELYEYDVPVVRRVRRSSVPSPLTWLQGPCSTCIPHLLEAEYHH